MAMRPCTASDWCWAPFSLLCMRSPRSRFAAVVAGPSPPPPATAPARRNPRLPLQLRPPAPAFQPPKRDADGSISWRDYAYTGGEAGIFAGCRDVRRTAPDSLAVSRRSPSSRRIARINARGPRHQLSRCCSRKECACTFSSLNGPARAARRPPCICATEDPTLTKPPFPHRDRRGS